MRKFIAIASIVTASLFANAQGEKLPPVAKAIHQLDPEKKDTVAVPVYITDRTDTIKVAGVLYAEKNGTVKYASPGYLIIRGKIAQTQGREPQWITQPETIGALDERKRPLNLVKL